MTLSILSWIILITIINGLLGLSGIFTFFISKENLNKILLFLVSFSIGALLGGALFHFIPEALKTLSIPITILITIIGAIVFYLTEKILHWHHCHKTGVCIEHPYSHLVLYGDAIHNFIDGIIIAGSFIISIPFGLMTSLLILLHELPQEIGDFGILIHGGFEKKKALIYNFIAQLTAILGGLLGYFFLNISKYIVYLLPFAAGAFLYLAIGDLIPEVLKEKSKKKRIANLAAIILGLVLLVSTRILIG